MALSAEEVVFVEAAAESLASLESSSDPREQSIASGAAGGVVRD